MTKRKNGKRPRRFLGTFDLPGGRRLAGELQLRGKSTQLTLHSDEFFSLDRASRYLRGVAQTGDKISLIDCGSPGPGMSTRNGSTSYFAEAFPHYVVFGASHIDPDRACVTAVHFTSTDVERLFCDFDAFGRLVDAGPVMDRVLAERRALRPVDTGDSPEVFYFTGRHVIARVFTAAGTIQVHHQPRSTLSGPSGFSMKNRIVVSIFPDKPVQFEQAIDLMHDVGTFLSMAAGRAQGIKGVLLSIGKSEGGDVSPLAVEPTFGWKCPDKSGEHQPSPGDVPLDPVRRPNEFSRVLVNWIARMDTWRIARTRYLECLKKANYYSPSRLVVAANMFELLPAEALPSKSDLSPEMAAAKADCIARLRLIAADDARDSALDALGRLGKPSLRAKIAHRAAIVQAGFGGEITDLDFAIKVAIKCRNFFVHGAEDFDYARVERSLAFLTDTLEFVFAASDFIEAGWDAKLWNSEGHGWGHNFGRYRDWHRDNIRELRRAVG